MSVKADFRVGESKLNKQGCLMKIIEYNNSDNIMVEFENPHYKTNSSYYNFKRGKILNRYAGYKFGVGYLGDASAVESCGKYKKSYKYWSNMLRRCYRDNDKNYKDCFVCDEWLCFENFEKWFYKEFPKTENKDLHLSLDKDIKSYYYKINKQYSPETCCFIPREINIRFKTDIVSYIYDNKYKNYRVRIQGDDCKKYCTVKTKEEAIKIIEDSKDKIFKEVANKYKDIISEETYEILSNIYNR